MKEMGGFHHPHPRCYLHLRGPHATCHGRVHAGAVVCGHFSHCGFPFIYFVIPSFRCPCNKCAICCYCHLFWGGCQWDCQDAARTQGGNPSNNSVLPARTVAAIPARSVEPPNHVPSVLVPVKVRSQVALPWTFGYSYNQSLPHEAFKRFCRLRHGAQWHS
jgi:hypothetical protein